ncbi:SusE domain-containing protein [Olleya sp. Ti.3.14]|uniref:SusE domain-containing protein n=1 Tax=Olleya sp. Ti.3.14 TaxID=3121297 RepID=UPI00311E3F89
MKNFKILLLVVIAMIGFNSCQEDDDLVFTAAPTGDFTFSNSFLEQYVLTSQASGNIAERFTWDDANFNVATNTSYELQRSLTGDFTDMVVVETTSANELAVTIGDMLSIAEEAGLNNDPATPEQNAGSITFRLRAYVGDTGNGTELMSFPQVLNVYLPPVTNGGGGSGIEPSIWGVVGSAANDWGNAGPDLPFYTTSDPDVLVAYVNLKDGEIKIRQSNDWSLPNYGDATLDGVLDTDNDNNIAVTAGDYKIVYNTSTLDYTIETFSYGIVGSAYNDWGNAGPDAKFHYDYTTDTFKVGVRLIDGEMKVRFNQDWGLPNYGDATLDGVLDTDSDNNIAVTAGFYLMTINLNDFSYTLVPTDLWGVVGSGYNDWGNAGPDATFTPLTDTQWLAENVTLIDGEIKIRLSEDWSLINYGDATSDGVLDTDNDNNIVVTAGVYDIKLDFTDPGAPTYVFITK